AALAGCQSIDQVGELAKKVPDVLVAAGVSAKAARHLRPQDREEIIEEILYQISSGGAIDWRDELLTSFLLTSGDSVGGIIRNWIGNEAKRRFSAAVRERLERSGVIAKVTFGGKSSEKVAALTWSGRAIVFDVKI